MRREPKFKKDDKVIHREYSGEFTIINYDPNDPFRQYEISAGLPSTPFWVSEMDLRSIRENNLELL